MSSATIDETTNTPPATEVRPLRWVWEHWQTYRSELPILLALTLANAAVLASYPFMLKRIIDGIQDSLTARYLVINVGILVGVGITHFLIYVFMQYKRARQNIRFEFSVRVRVFEHLQNLGQSFFSRFRTGDLVTRMNDDVNDKLTWYMCSGIGRLIEAVAVIIFGVGMMLWINPELTLYTAGPLPILVGLFVLTADKLHQRYAAVQKTISELNDSLESCFSGIRVVKAFSAEETQRVMVEEAIEQQRKAEIQAVRWQTLIDSFYGNIWQLAIIGVLLAGGAMAIRGDLSLGTIVAFDSYVLMLVWPMFDVGQFLVRGKLSAVSIGRISELETTAPEVAAEQVPSVVARRPFDPMPTDDTQHEAEPTRLTVSFNNVTYQYPTASEPALNELSFQAQPGKLTALAGEVGSGKSTALLMIPRIMDCLTGKLELNGQDIREWSLPALRQSIGYVPQEAQLLSGTIHENICFGREWVTDDDVQMAVELAQLRNDLAIWPDGLETMAGSRGLRLSGGQKQRVSLARAIAGHPSILLLDDCTASLDAKTEELVWQRILETIPHCTTLLVTHRPATLERSDQIIVLDQGTVREQGTFAELNREETYFHQLYVRWQLEEHLE